MEQAHCSLSVHTRTCQCLPGNARVSGCGYFLTCVFAALAKSTVLEWDPLQEAAQEQSCAKGCWYLQILAATVCLHGQRGHLVLYDLSICSWFEPGKLALAAQASSCVLQWPSRGSCGMAAAAGVRLRAACIQNSPAPSGTEASVFESLH